MFSGTTTTDIINRYFKTVPLTATMKQI